ncbi:MAG TPA: hypothetical protein VF629_20850 [Hymenobacter sp.]|jgi:hypothetical protein|uniref:hypothetical protein n=1 Tax=Hymenobacter sp. TaxID=1898978 RepID=UPI002EDA1B8B
MLALAEAANGTVLASGARTSAPELVASVRMVLDLVAARSGGSPFSGAAYALSCPEGGELGLKEAIASVEVTSTGLFNGIAAGQSLQRFVQCSDEYSTRKFPLAQLADSLNKKESYPMWAYRTIRLHISPKPADNSAQQFEVRLQLANGQELTQLTPAIIWD